MRRTKVRRWTRGLHDRLYISTIPTGAEPSIDIGWFDLRTQRQQLMIPGMMAEFDAAITWWRHLPKGQQAAVLADETADLAATAAGTQARERAQQVRPGLFGRTLARLTGRPTPDQSWRVGAAGEDAVATKLDTLNRRGWHVLHSIDTGAGDIDHLAIGPHGVFVINTKHHRGSRVDVTDRAVTVNGYRQQYPAEVSREAALARAALGQAWGHAVHVTPLIVVHGHTSITGWQRHHPGGVRVLPSHALTAWLRSPGPTIHNTADVEQLYAAARRPTTWRTATARPAPACTATAREHGGSAPAAMPVAAPAFDPRTPHWRARIEHGDPYEQFTDAQAAAKLGLPLAEFLHLVVVSQPFWDHPAWGRPPLPLPTVITMGSTHRLWARWGLAEHFGAPPAPPTELEQPLTAE
ncbi:nuclease-related domain-containing protein [Hamadaea tsunoensis]|uniref:nuclease-related domain-containing protein n=1 Tax=Hamadaea tsunoensis TaxID=53368 RepID=UPI0012F97A6B|nr:nuclease-related domain-containing protein [Hamadaea tsunoensis]